MRIIHIFFTHSDGKSLWQAAKDGNSYPPAEEILLKEARTYIEFSNFKSFLTDYSITFNETVVSAYDWPEAQWKVRYTLDIADEKEVILFMMQFGHLPCVVQNPS